MSFDEIINETKKINPKALKIYNFMGCGEFIFSLEAENDKQAAEDFKRMGYTKRDIDRVEFFSRQTGRYKVTNEIWRFL